MDRWREGEHSFSVSFLVEVSFSKLLTKLPWTLEAWTNDKPASHGEEENGNIFYGFPIEVRVWEIKSLSKKTSLGNEDRDLWEETENGQDSGADLASQEWDEDEIK